VCYFSFYILFNVLIEFLEYLINSSTLLKIVNVSLGISTPKDFASTKTFSINFFACSNGFNASAK